MTNGRGATMASFMTKKKKYKFQVEVCLEELLEVPFVSAVLFAKLRLMDGGNFQDHSSREEVRDHTVKWGARFSFPCKMLANASTGVLERSVLRISVRKECKGGRSFTKLGFVDLNLAEYAGAGETFKKALLEGYDTRHRQDNSMLRFSIKMNMLSGDILFKVPSPSSKHKQVATSTTAAAAEENSGDSRTLDEFSSGSLAGSIASGSSGFGSLPKKRPQLLSSDLVIGHTLSESNMPAVTVAIDGCENIPVPPSEVEEVPCEPGHSRNSSNTSQMSKASGYSSIHSHSHSRQSSSGDSGHIRDLLRPKRGTAFNIPSSFPEVSAGPVRIKTTLLGASYGDKTPEDTFSTPKGVMMSKPNFTTQNGVDKLNTTSSSVYYTPRGYYHQISNSSVEEYKTPEGSIIKSETNFLELQKSFSTDTVGHRKTLPSMSDNHHQEGDEVQKPTEGVLRSKSDYQIPRLSPSFPYGNGTSFFNDFAQKSDNMIAFLTPLAKRRAQHLNEKNNHSTPKHLSTSSRSILMPGSPIQKFSFASLPQTRTTSLTSLQTGIQGLESLHVNNQHILRSLPHRKLLEGNSAGGKLAPLAISPDEAPSTVSSECSQIPAIRRPSVTTNPSSSSLVLSETGSLDRAKAALERRKKSQAQEPPETSSTTGRVEVTRVNPDDFIAELLKNTKLDLEQSDETAETSGLQLFIAKDGTAALGNHEVKSQMSTGVQVFKQVVMEDNR